MSDKAEQLAVNFCNTPIWQEAAWLAISYQWHPTSAMPPIMGIVFGDWMKGVELFRVWVDAVGNADEDDDLRVAILEGEMPGQTDGYTVRLSPSLNEFLEDDDEDRKQIGRVVRMHPQFGNGPDMLARFKKEYERHGEFMLAPVVQRDDDQLYMNVHQGIIKRELIVRQVSEIGQDEPDMLALRACDDEKVMWKVAEHLRQIVENPLPE